jgi:hypothetical protein
MAKRVASMICEVQFAANGSMTTVGQRNAPVTL